MSRMRIRFPHLPCVDNALQETRAKFGIIHGHEFTDAEREMAERFDVKKALEKALESIQLRDKMI